ncbi:MAG TPA: hypothetical protein ENI85_13395 [Deltaproteobacteria bacterium]|nr:hypothetical protein [Deltaproteobacteria bacterium]
MRTRFDFPGLIPMVIVLGALACATKDARWVNEHLELSENFHAGTKVLETPPIPDTGAHRAWLRATGRTRGPRRGADIELAVRAEFEDFSFLDRVSFASGRAYPLTVVKRENEDCGTTDISLCNVHEDVSVRLSRKFLIAKRATGFHVKLWGRRESVVLFVPPEYIEGLISRMENREPRPIEALKAAPPASVPAAADPAASARR